MQQIRLLGTTAFFTVFIWVSANQLLTETADVPITLTVRAEPNSRLVISPAPGAPETYVVSISGRKADVAALREQGILPVTLTLRDEAVRTQELGPLNLPLQDELKQLDTVFVNCSVQSVNPPAMPVVIDRRVDVPMPVRVRPGRLEYAVEPRVDQDTVQVTLLESIHTAIQTSNPRIVLDAATYLTNQPEGEPVKLDVRIEPMIDTDRGLFSAIRTVPELVTLRATLRRRLKEGTIQAVPIKFLVSPQVHRRYDIEFRKENPDETLSIDVIGTPEEVDRLVSGERKTFAVISLGSPGPLASGTYDFYEPEFTLPPGVRLVDDQPIPRFELRLVPRKPSEPGEQ